jgi:hypothetical protein
MWYIDSGASRHMTGVREHLTDLTEIGDVKVVLGDDWVVKAVGCGNVSFQRESLPPLVERGPICFGLEEELSVSFCY